MHELSPKVDGEVSITASLRQQFDMKLIANGGFGSLKGFMTSDEQDSVLKNYRLTNGELWPIPIVFDVDAEERRQIMDSNGKIRLTDAMGSTKAYLNVFDVQKPDKKMEGELVYGGDQDHCEIAQVNSMKEFQIGGELELVDEVEDEDYTEQRRGPEELKILFKELGWDKIVAFQTRNPMHQAHIELTKRACENHGCNLLINPVVGPTKPGDIDYRTRMKCQLEIIKDQPEGTALLNTLPLAMRMGGPREAMMHALIRKNQGVTHFILGRDHAGPGKNRHDNDIYGPYEARDFVLEQEKEIGITLVPFDEMVYIDENKKQYPIGDVPKGLKPLKISGTEVRRRLVSGEDIPSWFSNPKVVKILQENAKNNKN